MHDGVLKKCWTYVSSRMPSTYPKGLRSRQRKQTSLTLRSSTHSERGNRAQNQDRCFANDALGLFIVVDGMGGSKGGSIASQITMQVLVQRLGYLIQSRFTGQVNTNLFDDLNQCLKEALESIYESMHRVALARADLKDMGCTFAAAVMDNDQLYFCHTGDTRVYLLDGRLRQITEDETIAQELLRAGLIDKSDVSTSAWRHTVTQCVSAHHGFSDENEHHDAASPRWQAVDIREGSLVLLTTNGLNEALDRRELERVMLAHRGETDLAKRIVEQALQISRRHNTSCIACETTALFENSRTDNTASHPMTALHQLEKVGQRS